MQECCGVSILGEGQNPTGCGPMQPVLAGPASPEASSNLHCSVILLFMEIIKVFRLSILFLELYEGKRFHVSKHLSNKG